MTWRTLSASIVSRGKVSRPAGSLADLHRRRAETQSQYFTPEWIAVGIWDSLREIVEKELHRDGYPLSCVDSSIGSGALFQGAPVEQMALYGVDTDGRCIDALSSDAQSVGLNFEFINAGLEELEFNNFSMAVINSPYSISLDSPLLTPYACTHYGRYGQGTSAVSHEYALEQALDGADTVVAVLPESADRFCRELERLVMKVKLPGNAFKSEGANVKTAVYFFKKRRDVIGVRQVAVKKGEAWPVLSGAGISKAFRTSPVFRKNGIEETVPVITLPVTGDNRVGLHHHGRRVVLSFECGLTQARVQNNLLRAKASGERLPNSVTYKGDGALNLDVMLLQDEPQSQLSVLAQKIVLAGGDPHVSPTLEGYYRKLVRRHKRAIHPMRRVIQTTNTASCELVAKRRTLLDPKDFNSSSVAKGESVSAVKSEGEYHIQHKGVSVTLRGDEVVSRYTVVDNGSKEAGWAVLHEGLCVGYPELAKQYSSVLDREGIDWLAPFQRHDVIEGLISPYGFIGAHEQGCGKTRFAITLAMIHSGHNMIVVEAGLLPEFLRELEKLEKLGLKKSMWKVLGNNDDISSKISITTYHTLRRVSDTGKSNAKRWRRKVNLAVMDEGSLLANSATKQSRAVRALSARKNIVCDGTPVRNKPKSLLAISVASAGNGVAHQPYGVRGKSYLQQSQMVSSSQTMSGERAFQDDFIVTEWVTHEFTESGYQKGGRREIPRINNLPIFKKWISPNIQRRLRSEPDLSIFNNCPPPVYKTHKCEWDTDHFEHYLRVAREFSSWYRNAMANSNKNINLAAVLARIGAVRRAANSPHVESESLTMETYSPETSKQRMAMIRAVEWVNRGRKVILYAQSPDVLERMHGKFKRQYRIDSVLFTGRQNIAMRTSELDSKFRMGDVDLLLCSKVAQRGLNLPEASVVLITERGWSAAEEDQIIYRTQRPSQTKAVSVERFHLRGSIDEYCAQMQEWKRSAAAAGIDFGAQVEEDETFHHLDSILHKFCLGTDRYEIERKIAV